MRLRTARKIAARGPERYTAEQMARAAVVNRRSWLRAARSAYGGGGIGRAADERMLVVPGERR